MKSLSRKWIIFRIGHLPLFPGHKVKMLTTMFKIVYLRQNANSQTQQIWLLNQQSCELKDVFSLVIYSCARLFLFAQHKAQPTVKKKKRKKRKITVG